MRVLCIDPGEKRLGIALSDPTGTIANPLTVINHVSRQIDAATIAQIAAENGAEMIIIGQALDSENRETPQSRRAARLAAAIQQQSSLQVALWDEFGSTATVRKARIEMNASRRKRRGHLDDLAATYILQTFLDTKQPRSIST